MKIVHSQSTKDLELPLKIMVSFRKVFDFYSEYKKDKNHPYYKSAKDISEHLMKFPELIDGFDDMELLEKYADEIDLMLGGLFPEILTTNEIKAASVPFSFTSFKFSSRFEKILENAGEDYSFDLKDMHEDEVYIHACVMILGYCYGYQVDLKRPFFFKIPDKNLGFTKVYRLAFNADFAEVTPTENAPKITEEDYKLLLNNFHNIAIWKEKFPPGSYIFKGFGLMNLFDVTSEETLSSLKDNLLRSDENLITDLQQNLRAFYNIKDLKIGFSVYDSYNFESESTSIKKSESLILGSEKEIKCNGFFCKGIAKKVFVEHQPMTISDVEQYGIDSNFNPFYKNLKKENIQSLVLVPIKSENNNSVALLEIASPRPYELNSVTLNKLKDVIPVFKSAVERASDEHHNALEATIQEHYTTIHPAVKWRFYEAAEKFHHDIMNGIENPQLDDIVFNNVFPLYGQADIKGSSLARNAAIKKDLLIQLNKAVDVLQRICKTENMPIYQELTFRVEQYLEAVKEGLHAGDEIGIINFLNDEIYPVFNHASNLDQSLKKDIDDYMDMLDPQLQVVYVHRKEYEQNVAALNENLANHLDNKQSEAQNMFPHYYERYKTDGVEFNMYIGNSLVSDRSFNDIYLYNLRLWQLQVMSEMENIAHNLRKEMENPLEIASLILVHSNDMAIKFRMDEKQFDVDGAYNIRYEIIKKRIDKAHIKGTNERLTVPGKIAIVYSQDKDAREYMKYIEFLQSRNILGAVENLELEDLQGVSGLKALRVIVNYENELPEKSAGMTYDELMENIKS